MYSNVQYSPIDDYSSLIFDPWSLDTEAERIYLNAVLRDAKPFRDRVYVQRRVVGVDGNTNYIIAPIRQKSNKDELFTHINFTSVEDFKKYTDETPVSKMRGGRLKGGARSKSMKLTGVIDSPDKKKRYMAVFMDDDDNVKTVKFGDPKMKSYVMTGDKARRDNYRSRHAKDLNTGDPMRPGFLSMFILWGDSKNMNTNIKEYKRLFGL